MVALVSSNDLFALAVLTIDAISAENVFPAYLAFATMVMDFLAFGTVGPYVYQV